MYSEGNPRMQRKVIDVTKSVFLLEYIGHDHHSGKVIELSMSFKYQGHPDVNVIHIILLQDLSVFPLDSLALYTVYIYGFSLKYEHSP